MKILKNSYMELKQKYIITKQGRAIVFSELINHKNFKHFDPIRAGFVNFNINNITEMVEPKVHGELVSLNLKSDKELDEKIIKKEILGYSPYDL